MSLSVALLVLLAAVLHASWNTMVKIQTDRFTTFAVLAFSGCVVSIPAAFFFPLPAPESWPLLALSLVLHVGYNWFLIEAYRHGDLSQVYPLARGTTPLLILLLAAVFAGEAITPMSAAAVAIISTGIISLSFSGRTSPQNTSVVLWALGTSVWIAAYTVTDGIGARQVGNPHSFVIWLNMMWGLPLLVIGFYRRGLSFASDMRKVWRPGFAGGVIASGGYWIVVWAMAQAPIATVSALRETSVIIATLIGVALLKESFGIWRIGAAATVAAGIALLRFSS